MRNNILLLIFVLISGITELPAQQTKPSYGRITGYTVQSVARQDGTGNSLLKLPNATVRIVTGKDTLNTVSDMDGKFSFKKVPVGEAEISASHLGKLPFSAKILIEKDRERFVTIQLEEKFFDIDEVVVKGTIPLFVRRGDTVMINTSVIRTMEGDRAKEILKQIPGITIEESGRILAFGEPVVRTYLNKILMFGDDANTLFKYFPAKEVAQMQVYDENITRIDIDGNLTFKKERVINVKSITAVKDFTTGHFLANYGKDTKEDNQGNLPDRYRAGATVNFFSEKTQVYFNIFTNNVNDNANKISNVMDARPTAGYGKLKSVDLGYNRLLKSNTTQGRVELKVNYSYNDRYARNELSEYREYFSTDKYAIRNYEKNSLSESSGKYHNFNISLGGPLLMLTHSMRFSDNVNSSVSQTNTFVDAERDLSKVENRTEQSSFNMKDNFLWWVQNKEKTRMLFIMNLSSDISNDNGTRWRKDTLSSDLTTTVFQSSPLGRSTDLTVSVNDIKLGKLLNSNWQLKGRVNYRKSRSKELRFLLDQMSNPVQDNINSFDYTYNYTTYIIGIDNLKTRRFINGPKTLKLQIFFNSSRLNREEIIPAPLEYGKTFNSVTFSISGGKNFSKNTAQRMYMHAGVKSFNYNYSTSAILPSVEQLRQQVDDSNPLYLVAGNMDLKQSYKHSLDFSLTLPPVTLRWNTTLTQNSIVQKQSFFSDEIVLADYYNYIAPKYSTLTTYKNSNGEINSTLSAAYDVLLNKIKSRLQIKFSGDYNRFLSYLYEKENVTNNYGTSQEMTFSTHFSKVFRINLNSRSSYNYSHNSIKDSYKYLRNNTNLTVEWNFLERCYMNTLYKFSTYKSFDTNISYTTNICNIAAGMRIFKNKLDIGFSVFDLFNRSVDFKTTMFSDYIQNTWTPTFGRYWSVNVVFKFDALNRNKSGFAPNPG
jgi:hypothetical protein